MKKAVRRALRGWKEEFSRNWQRLNTFMRVVLGVILAMVMVWAARRWMLDPLQDRLVQIREENMVIDMPDGIIRPEHDVEIQDNILKAENLGRSLETSKQKVLAAASSGHVVSPAKKGEVLTAMNQLISQHRLLLRRHEEIEIEEETESPVPLSRHAYSVTGPFKNVRAFLHALNAFGFLSWFDAFELQIMTDENSRVRRVGGQVCLELNFECTLYYYKGGANS